MVDRADRAYELVLTRDVADLNAFRGWLSDRLDGITGDLDEVVIMATELVTNVIRHTSSVPRVTVTIESDCLRIAVYDAVDGQPTLRPLDPARAGGNGLRIVDTWSDSWGSDRRPGGGKAVWFTVALD